MPKHRKHTIKGPAPKPFTRAPIPPAKRMRDRKHDFMRQPKHRNHPHHEGE